MEGEPQANLCRECANETQVVGICANLELVRVSRRADRGWVVSASNLSVHPSSPSVEGNALLTGLPPATTPPWPPLPILLGRAISSCLMEQLGVVDGVRTASAIEIRNRQTSRRQW